MDDASERSVPSISSATCLECGAKWGQAPRPWGDSVMELDAYAEHVREHDSVRSSESPQATSPTPPTLEHEYPCDDFLCRPCHAIAHNRPGPFAPVDASHIPGAIDRNMAEPRSSAALGTTGGSDGMSSNGDSHGVSSNVDAAGGALGVPTIRAEGDALAREVTRMREGVKAVIRERSNGDFAPLLPKLRALLDVVAPSASSEVRHGE